MNDDGDRDRGPDIVLFIDKGAQSVTARIPVVRVTRSSPNKLVDELGDDS